MARVTELPAVAAGLTAEEAARRLERDGPNALPLPPRPSWLRRLLGELVHFFAVLLWATSVMAFVAGMPELSVAIAGVVVINAVFAFGMEVRATRAADRLRDLLPRQVMVRRDATALAIDARDVVIGDRILLAPGDRIAADATVAIARNAVVDTSMLTGESVPSPVATGDALFAGTFAVEGEIEADVTAIGGDTRLAQITRLTTATAKHETPLTSELRDVVHRIAAIAVCVGGVFFAVMMAFGKPASDGFLLAIGVTVALIPEALLPTVTLSLAWGAEHLARRRVLVRNLEAVETLGSTTIVCTDKTGTLTRNEMTVVAAWTPAGVISAAPGYTPDEPVVIDPPSARPAFVGAAEAGVLCSIGWLRRSGDRWVPQGDPMEVAIDVFARRLGVDTDRLRIAATVVERFPFDPRRRRMSVVTPAGVFVKGAPDAVLALCAPVLGADDAVRDMSTRGLRVLAVAAKPTVDAQGAPRDVDAAESGLTLLALLGLEDPPRDDVSEAIETCRRAGVKVVMITGDHPTTATAIGVEVGLPTAMAPVVVGRDLPADDDELAALVDHDGAIVARVSPEDKLRIARALRRRGHVVAMTGDGVNDGPALHEADVGIAMGESGTDVAREAADLVLLDDHFATIVAGIEQGRATYVNVRKFLTYHLTDNVAEVVPFAVWALSGGRVPLGLTVLQILALDIGTDTLSATALGAEPARPGLLAGRPVSGRLLNGMVARRAFGIFGPVIAAGSMLAFLASFWQAGWRPGDTFPSDALASASGATFMTIVIAQTANVFASRSSVVLPSKLGWFSNRLLVPAASIELCFSLLVLFVPSFASVLEHASPPIVGWVIAFFTAGAVLIVDAIDKTRRARRRSLSRSTLSSGRPEDDGESRRGRTNQ